MNTHSDSAMGQAFREVLEAIGTDDPDFARAVKERAAKIDATQPAAAGELPEAVAWVYRAGPLSNWQTARSEALAKSAADVYRRDGMVEADWRALYDADQLRAAVAGKDEEIAKLQALRKHHRARHKSYKRRCHDLEAAVAGYRRDADLKVCTWSQEDEQGDCFDTSCGHVYMVNDAETGGMKFCTFCGGDMKVAMWAPDDDDDAALANLGSGDGKEGGQ